MLDSMDITVPLAPELLIEPKEVNTETQVSQVPILDVSVPFPKMIHAFEERKAIVLDSMEVTEPETALEFSIEPNKINSDVHTSLLLVPDVSVSSPKSKKCTYEGCTHNSRGSSGLCVNHGGGRRCSKSECRRGARSNSSFCSKHGGGIRCKASGCDKGALSGSQFCHKHGQLDSTMTDSPNPKRQRTSSSSSSNSSSFLYS
jgi:hypothetical protein